MNTPRIDDRDWSALTLGEQIRQIEVEGYLLLPDLLSPDHVARLKSETAKLETTPVDYSVHQRGCPNLQFRGGAITELLAHPPTLSFLRELFGDEIIMMSYGYARSEPGHPGISLHTDGQPYGSQIFGYDGSVPFMVRVLYYLADLTPEVLLLPDLLSPDHVARLKSETAKLETTPVDYSVHQRGCPNLQFRGGAITELLAHPPTLSFLRELFGDEIIMMSYGYARSEPGHPGISLHTDGQPYGSQIFGYDGSVPFMVRVLYYLADLTPEVSPFRVIPRSHLSMHADANPYKRFESHPEEVMVPAKAGSAVLINHKVFHGNYPNVGDYPREMLAIAYRPGWAGPQDEVSTWEDADLAKLPDSVRPLFSDRNTRDWAYHGGNKPPNMKKEAPGMNPSRWERV